MTRWTSRYVAGYAVLLVITGLSLLFSPESFDPTLDLDRRAGKPLVQVLGAACIGFAVACWTARRALLGGIYGRAVVSGVQVFTFIGFLVLITQLSAPVSTAFWALLILLAFGMALFSWFLFGGTPVEPMRDED
ncbi:MAG: hypothetical protein AAGI08_04545 [Bacteroidota bacterium]